MVDEAIPVKVVDSILAADLKDLINLNPDVVCSKEIKDKINNYDDNKLLKYTKELGSITIIAVEEITKESIIRELS